MYSVSILLCLFLFHTSVEETTTMTSVSDRDRVINSQIKDQGNKIAKLTALVVKLESEMAKITHIREATTTTTAPSMTAATTTSTTTSASETTKTAANTAKTAATKTTTTAAPSTTTSAAKTAATSTTATPPMTAASTKTTTTMGPLNVGVGDQALLLHIKDQDIKIAELKALLEHQIYKVKIQVEHQNTKFSEENVKFSEENAKFLEVNAKFSAENAKFAKVETKFYKLESEIKRLTHSQTATTSSPQTTTSSTIDTSSGVVFTRWGRGDCPAGISTPVYNGTLGGSHYDHTGAAVNRLCMPHDPTWDVNKLYKDTLNFVGYVYGGHYNRLPDFSLNAYVPPCAVCRAALFSTKVVIPGRNTCYPGWTKAYSGELTSDRHGHKGAAEYTCLDRQPQKGVYDHGDGVWLSPVLAKCGALPCPPYQDEALLTCVVCLK